MRKSLSLFTMFFILGLGLFGICGDLMLVGPIFDAPEKAVHNYWDSMEKGNFIKAVMSFNDVYLINAPQEAADMVGLPKKISKINIRFIKKTVINSKSVHLQYWVHCERKTGKKAINFISGDLMIKDKLGWKILQPMSNPPK